MSVKPIRYDEEAEAELVSAARWYESREDGLGFRFYATVKGTELMIQHGPEAWQAMPDTLPEPPVVRRRFVEGFPYQVVYLELDEEIRVIAVAHTRRRPNYWRYRTR